MRIAVFTISLFISIIGLVFNSNAAVRIPVQPHDKYWYENGKQPDPMNVRILFLGDALMNGYGLPDEKLSIQNQITSRISGFRTKVRPVFKSLSSDGMTTAIAVTKAKEIIEMRPHLLVLSVGISDAIKNNDVDIVHNNLTVLLTELQRARIYVMLVGIQATPQMGGYQYMSGFNSIYARLASQFNLPFMPYLLENISGNPQKFQNNNIYPNADGASDVANNFVNPYLQRVLYPLDKSLSAQRQQHNNQDYKNKKQLKNSKKVIIKN
jgi:acyl-CoA thioesterase I